GLRAHETDPVFLPARGGRLPLALAVVNVALAIGPDGRLYALGSEDSAATRLRVDVLDAATGRILETRRLGAGRTAVAVDARGALAVFDADSLLATAQSPGREPFTPAFALPDLRGGGGTHPPTVLPRAARGGGGGQPSRSATRRGG